jgi:hypothetical protein
MNTNKKIEKISKFSDVKPPNGYRLLVSGEVTKRGDLVFPGLKWRTTKAQLGFVWTPDYLPMARRSNKIKSDKIISNKENVGDNTESLDFLVFKSQEKLSEIVRNLERRVFPISDSRGQHLAHAISAIRLGQEILRDTPDIKDFEKRTLVNK